MSPEPHAFDPAGIFTVLNNEDVNYVVIGGVAAALHGSSVRTGDSGICPQPCQPPAAGTGTDSPRRRDPHRREPVTVPATAELLDSTDMWNLVTDHFGALEIAFRPSGTSGYGYLIVHALTFDVGDGLLVRVASLDDVIRSKEAANRAEDREHLLFLRAMRELQS